MDLLAIIFPKKCVNCKKMGDYLCTDCFSFLSYDVTPICLICNKPALFGVTHLKCSRKYGVDGSFSALKFNPVAKRLLYNFKYKPYLSDLTKFLAELMYESLIQNEEFMRIIKNKKVAFSCIPIHSSRFKKRGYNQAELLGKDIAKKFNLEFVNLLSRVIATPNQARLDKKAREENVKGVFKINVKVRIPSVVFLVDDVVTTGSTLKEAAKVLKREGAGEVYGLTFAQD